MSIKVIKALIILLICPFISQAQSPQCDVGVPFFNVNLTGNNDSLWLSSNVVRSGLCCGLDPLAKPPIRCVQFAVTLDSNSAGIKFDIASGAVPPGALGYSIDCGAMYQVGDVICLDPPWPRYLTFCKPGNNPNTYSIQAIPKPKVSPPVVVSDGCLGSLTAEGFVTSTIKWSAVPANALYDSYLNCTAAVHYGYGFLASWCT